MNGFTILKERYEKMQEETGTDFGKEIRACEILENCTEDDVYLLAKHRGITLSK